MTRTMMLKMALMIAAEQGSCEIIKLLLEHGADINAVNTVVIGSNVVTVEGFEFFGLFRQDVLFRHSRNL